ncbi:MAG: PEP-CTERM sorting domain-containing protein [Phycisphaerales bacterium]
MEFKGITRGLVATAVLAAGGTSALAGQNDVVFRIEALSDGNLSVYEVHFADGTWSDDGLSWEWNYDGDTFFFGSGAGGADMGLGGFDNASLSLDYSSRATMQTVNLNFDVFAGASNTAFSIGSGPLNFAQFSTAQGIASASVGVTDVLGGGATLAPNAPGMYRAFYNGGTTFADLLASSLVAGQFSSAQADDDFGFAAIGVPVDEIAAEWAFTLTAFDSAAGTSTFSVVPAPGSALLLGLAGLTATRRRRH